MAHVPIKTFFRVRKCLEWKLCCRFLQHLYAAVLHAAAAAIPTYLYEAHAVILYMPGVDVTLR